MEGPIQKILVYIDGSEESITAAQFALCLSNGTAAELFALYVINTRALDDLVKARIFLHEEQQEYQHDLEVDAERYLNHMQSMARQKSLKVKTVQASGTVHTEIKKKVQEYHIDLLVIGELSTIRSRRDVLYDEVERAMRSTPCSVLIVKDEERVWNLYESL